MTGVKPDEQLARRPDMTARLAPSAALQYTWYEAARDRAWSTLAIIPAEPTVRAVELARGFGVMAMEKPGDRVLIVDASLRRCRANSGNTARPIADIWADLAATRLEREQSESGLEEVSFAALDLPDAEQALSSLPHFLAHLAENRPFSTVIFAVDSLLDQPRAIPVTRAVDKVLLCFTLGVTTFKAAKRLVELVGREKLLGSVTLRRST